MAIRHIVAAFECRGLNPSQKLVLLKLADNANDDGLCWPSKAHIIEQTGLSRSTVRRCVRQLAAAGLLSIDHRYTVEGEPTSNLYQLHLGGGSTMNPPGSTMTPGVGSPWTPEPSDRTVNQSNPLCAAAHDQRFDDFWSAWPKGRRRAKKKAREAWKRKRLDKRADEIIADVRNRIANDEQWKRGYIPMPTTYINGERWEDELETVETSEDRKKANGALWEQVEAAAGSSSEQRRQFMNQADPKVRRAIASIGGLKQIGLMQPHQIREARSRFYEAITEKKTR